MITFDLSKLKHHKCNMLYCTLYMKEGVIYKLVGKNGSGKTTLLNYIFKYHIKYISNKIIYCPDYYIGYQNITVKENEKIYQLSSSKWDYQVYEYLYQQLLNVNKKRYIRTLSSGEKTKLLLCVLLAFKPNFIIFDEALYGVDKQSKIIIMDYIQNYLKKNNAYFIFVSHDNELAYYIDKTIDIDEVIIDV